MKYSEGRIATTSRTVQTKTVRLPQITACMVNYTDQKFFGEENLADLEPAFDPKDIVVSISLGV